MELSEERAPALDVESEEWIGTLTGAGTPREAALARLHDLLLRVAVRELRRRAAAVTLSGGELDDLAYQAAADAMVAVLAKLDTFRGESRFTTWAYKFVILEVSSKLGRHYWRRPDVALEPEQWERVPERLGATPEGAAEAGELFAAVRQIVQTQLTPRQREIFVALLVHGIPADALAVKLQTNRNALYKAMFDARRKIRAALVTDGYLADSTSTRS